MSVLSGQSIRRLNIFEPFSEKARYNGMSYGLSYCGYDVRINTVDGVQTPDGDHVAATLSPKLGNVPGIVLSPNQAVLASTVEEFTMPPNVVGIVHDKSTWARRGLAVQNTVIEPGWRGFLTLELTNHSTTLLSIFNGDPIAQILFHWIDEEPESGYSGKYQDQDRGGQPALFD